MAHVAQKAVSEINGADMHSIIATMVIPRFYVPQPLAVALYDGAVNMGPGRAVRQLQQGMNAVGEAQLDHYTSIAEDGVSGPRTAELAEALEAANLHWFAARQILRLRDAFYRDLAARRPSLKVFLEGWRNRVKALGQHLAELEREAH